MRRIEKQEGKRMVKMLEELCKKHGLLEDAAAEVRIDISTPYIWLMGFGFEGRWVKREAEPEQEGSR